MGVLKVKVNGVWEEAVPLPEQQLIPDEVLISNSPPFDFSNELWVDTGEDPPPSDEVVVGPDDPMPANPAIELWYDTDAVARETPGTNEVYVGGTNPEGLPGQTNVDLWYNTSTQKLMVKDDRGGWTEVSGGGAEADEVFLGPEDPRATNPESHHEMWYDTDELPAPGWGVNIAYWDSAVEYQKGNHCIWPVDAPKVWEAALTNSNLEPGTPVAETAGAWTLMAELNGPFLPLSGGTVSGPVILEDTLTANGPVTVNAPVNVYGQLGMGAGQKIQFPNETGPKIYAYAQTFGLGVESGELCVFGSSKVGFRQNASNGVYFGYVDANTGGGLIIDRDNCDARYAPIAARRANSVFADLGDFNLTGSYTTIHNASFSHPSGNRRLKVTVQLHVVPGGSQHVLIKCFGQETSWEKMGSITDTIGPAVFVGDSTGDYKAVVVEVKTDTGNGSVDGDSGSSWVLVEDLGPR